MVPGATLLHYRIVEKIGEGGMGAVWKAVDTTLGREVALKVLPEPLAADPERIARFDREAKVLASLNHPNVAAIYGFHEVEGVRFLAMELVPGEDLAQRIARGPIPSDDALRFASKIAEALEYAHERGIVHRDLKPANVKLTPDGEVKVLDFGLAKAIAGDPASSGSTSTPTILPTVTSAGTAVGMILGTAAYMSPEQARGKTVDKRADIWAFGVVAVEMLTGRRLFDGETVSDTIAGVLTRPIEVDSLPYASLWKRCLERDPKLRLRDIGEARIALQSPEAVAADVRRRPWGVAAALAGVAVVFAGIGYASRSSAPERAPAQRYALAIPNDQELSTAGYTQIAISSDGRRQVVVAVGADAKPHLLLRTEDAFEPRILAETEGAEAPFFSPDGAWIGYFRDGALYKIPVAGGAPVRLAEATTQPRGAAWGRDGYVYFSPTVTDPVMRVPEGGGLVENATTLDGTRQERTHRWPAALPDGGVLFTCDDTNSTEYYDDARIEMVRPSTGERKVLFEGASQAWYSPSGHLLVARGGSIFAVPFDEKSGEVRGTPAQVVQGVATDVPSGAVNFAISESGRALWIPGTADVDSTFAWFDRDGTETRVAIPPAPYTELALSPDGRKVVLTGGKEGNSDLWVADLGRGLVSRLSSGRFAASPVWSPDGTKIAFATGKRLPDERRTDWQILLQVADGSRGPEVLIEGERALSPSGFTPDGSGLLYDRVEDDPTRRDVWWLPSSGKREPRLLLGGPFAKGDAVVSPDGRWVAYDSDESGETEIYVRPFPEGPGRWQISTSGGYEPHWSPDGREIFYRALGVLYVVPVETSRGFAPGRPKPITDRLTQGPLLNLFGVAPDGNRIFSFGSPDKLDSRRTVYLDLGFSGRLGK